MQDQGSDYAKLQESKQCKWLGVTDITLLSYYTARVLPLTKAFVLFHHGIERNGCYSGRPQGTRCARNTIKGTICLTNTVAD